MNFYKHFLRQYLFLFWLRFQDNLGNLIDSLENIDNEINLDGKLTPKEKESFSKYLKEVVYNDEKVEIHELTRWKLREFITSEWWNHLESSLRWKWGIETLQEKLWVKIDGEFWPATLKALLDFQAKNNLIRDWLVWKETVDALNWSLKWWKITTRVQKKENKEISNTLKEVLSVFNKTRKWRIFLDYVLKYSEISMEKLALVILKSSKDFDIPQNRIVSVLVWEADISNKSNPFKANMLEKSRLAKWVWQFLPGTFKDLYSKVVWKKVGKNNIAVKWNILQYFEVKWEKKYATNLENIWINDLNDRYNPEKSIMAIWAYLRYIMLAWKWVNWDVSIAVARFNLWPNWNVANHLEQNPAVAEIYMDLYWKTKPTEKKLLIAAKKYYSQYA